ncbi:MAG: hypothetical protein K2O89_02255 [Clostridia bacterium]|nr:hypothetical protein [Clostridia bacterium]
MKLIELMQAREALAKLTDTHFTSYQILRELVKLKKRVDEEYEFYSTQEQKAVDLYAEKTEEGQLVFVDGGRLKLKDVKSKNAFDAEIAKLNETEVNDIPIVTIHESDFKSAADFPTATDMLSLSELITFEEG